MERRKVIRQGKGTLTMSLPSKWTNQFKIKQGDELFLEQKGFLLLISPTANQSFTSTEIDLEGIKSKGLAATMINNLYIKGYDEIKVNYYSPTQYDVISDCVRTLIGFEIISQKGNTCTIKELAKGESEDFDNILRRIFLLIIGSAEDGIDAYKKGDSQLVKSLEKRDLSVNTLINYSLRILNKKGGKDVQKSMHLYALLTLLEYLGDEYARLYREASKIKPSTIVFAERVLKNLREFYELFYKFDKFKADKLKEERDILREDITKALEKAKTKDDLLALHHFRRIADLVMDILKFNLAMQL